MTTGSAIAYGRENVQTGEILRKLRDADRQPADRPRRAYRSRSSPAQRHLAAGPEVGRAPPAKPPIWTQQRQHNAKFPDANLSGAITPPVSDGGRRLPSVHHQGSDDRDSSARARADETISYWRTTPFPAHWLPSFGLTLHLAETERVSTKWFSRQCTLHRRPTIPPPSPRLSTLSHDSCLIHAISSSRANRERAQQPRGGISRSRQVLKSNSSRISEVYIVHCSFRATSSVGNLREWDGLACRARQNLSHGRRNRPGGRFCSRSASFGSRAHSRTAIVVLISIRRDSQSDVRMVYAHSVAVLQPATSMKPSKIGETDPTMTHELETEVRTATGRATLNLQGH